MRVLRLLEPVLHTGFETFARGPVRNSLTSSCPGSCSALVAFPGTKRKVSTAHTASEELPLEEPPPQEPLRKGPPQKEPPQDHRTIGTSQTLFTTHASSPGAAFFQPNGTHIFEKLVSFLRAQFQYYGFREVLTPTMYKKSLWEQSGHWAMYQDDMYKVIGNSSKEPLGAINELETFGLKPMNCPGHCLLYESERRSYRDLPIRYAEFSPLHRNEISGALSGLTRVRRFHQDDGHIFCRPIQVKQEIKQSLGFVRMVYQTLGFQKYDLVLSTRPKDYIGTIAEWKYAEGQLKTALNEVKSHDAESGKGWNWSARPGEGAFYGPKIDIIVKDNQGKSHQTGTIQLDFQLPKRFQLSYDCPAVEMEASGEDWESSKSITELGLGSTTPVMIHRAIFGSLERFMALILEQFQGRLPFWLSPKQVVILTVTDKAHIVSYVREVKRRLLLYDKDDGQLPRPIGPPLGEIDIDHSADTVAQKIARAKTKKYSVICIVGEKNVPGSKTGNGDTLDVDISALPDQLKTWTLINEVRPGSQAPVQKDRGTGAKFRGQPGVRLSVVQFKGLMRRLNAKYC